MSIERRNISDEMSKVHKRRQMLESWRKERLQKQDKENNKVGNKSFTPIAKRETSKTEQTSKTTDDVALTSHERQTQRQHLRSIDLNTTFPATQPTTNKRKKISPATNRQNSTEPQKRTKPSASPQTSVSTTLPSPLPASESNHAQQPDTPVPEAVGNSPIPKLTTASNANSENLTSTTQVTELLEERTQLQHQLDRQQAEIESLKITLELYRNRTIADSLGSRKLHAEHSDIEVEQVQQLSHHNEEQSTYQDVEQKSSGRIKEKLTEMRTTIKKNESVIAKLKELLVSSLKENQRLENDLRRKTLKAEEFETQLTEMSLLYNAAQRTIQANDIDSNNNNAGESNNNQYFFDAIQERTEVILEMRQEMKRLREENSALRFSNELLMQQMGEMRGRFVTRLQELHRQQQAAQNEYKADMDAWNTLMNTTVKKLQDEMGRGLRESVFKISNLEQQLQEQRELNVQLQQQLSQFAQLMNSQVADVEAGADNRASIGDVGSYSAETESEVDETPQFSRKRQLALVSRRRDFYYDEDEDEGGDSAGEGNARDRSMEIED